MPTIATPQNLGLADAWPRIPEERYRIVVLVDDLPVTLASTADAEGVGLALVTLAEEGQLEGRAVGVLDTHGANMPGDWILNPWAGRAERRWV